MLYRIAFILVALLLSQAPAIAVSTVDLDETAVAMVPGVPVTPAAVSGRAPECQPAAAKPVPDMCQFIRVSGDVSCGSADVSTAATSGREYTGRLTVKSGKGAWCEIQFADVILRCWQNTEVLLDTSHQLVHVKTGSVIARKSPAAASKETLLVAGDRTLLLDAGIAQIDVDACSARIKH